VIFILDDQILVDAVAGRGLGGNDLEGAQARASDWRRRERDRSAGGLTLVLGDTAGEVEAVEHTCHHNDHQDHQNCRNDNTFSHASSNACYRMLILCRDTVMFLEGCS
jgi:hypothetical protein